MSERKTFYLIDGHAQFFRAYHAIRTGMTSPVTNEPTNLSYGFVGILIKLLRDYHPDYLAVAVDVSGDRESFRSELYADYKANREKAPDDFHPQVERCIEILEAMEVPIIGESGVEADDVIATLVKRVRADHPDVDIRIVSRDKDLAQLVGDHVELLDIYKETTVAPSDVFKTEGVEPHHVADILALMGDTSDNIPGVPGIGPKTAAKLIIEYGTIDNLLNHIGDIKGKRRENLEANREQIALSRQLVALVEDVDVEFELARAETNLESMKLEPVLAVFRQLGFGGHGNNLRTLIQAGQREAESASDLGGLFDQADDETPATPARRGPDTTLVRTAAELDALATALQAAGRAAMVTYATSEHAVAARVYGVAFSVVDDAGWYVVLGEGGLDDDMVAHALSPIFANGDFVLIGHDLKREQILWRKRGLALPTIRHDLMIASYVLDATRSSHALNVLALALLGRTLTPIGEITGTGRNARELHDVTGDVIGPWAVERAGAALRLGAIMLEELDQLKMRALYDDIELPLVDVLAAMEEHGIIVDPDELDRQRERLVAESERLRTEIRAASPHEFSPDSPKQLAAALFNGPDDEPPGLGLKVIKRGKTGPSTDQEVLEKLAADDTVDSPVPQLIVEYRKLTKLISTYLESLKHAINPETKRIHALFHQAVAATGRLSSSDPNLQNIPIRTEVGREIRRAFVAPEGHMLVTADYSQIELRLLAHLAQDQALIDAFRAGLDIHTAVAAEVYDIDPADVTVEQRGTAKMVNFGIVYGITPYGLARRLGPGVSVSEARDIIDGYKQRFRGIDAFLATCIEMAETHGYVETILGRRRAVPQIRERHPQRRSLGERMAINTVVQGSAADLIKLAMLDLYRSLPSEFPDAAMILQIHDELVFECPAGCAESLAEFVRKRMSAAMDVTVDLVVETAWSPNWIDAK